MDANPNEHYLIAKERAADAQREAALWRQHQAVRRQERLAAPDPAIVLGLRRLLMRLRAARAERTTRPVDSSARTEPAGQVR